ncbi:MAG: hypothetical protein AAGF54_19565 [Pseudomonadota bacterium]
MKADVETNLSKLTTRLKQGLMTFNRDIIDQESINLVGRGVLVVPEILEELRKIDLEKDFSREKLSLVSGLTVILRDIDEETAERFVQKALRGNVNPIIRTELEHTLRFSLRNYRQSYYGDVLVLEEKNINPNYDASTHVKIWLSSVPETDLQGITRIYILKDDEAYSFAGNYAPGFAKINVVWDSMFRPHNPMVRLTRYLNRHTLYHEIGHHRFRHTYGQDPLQERVADEYAAQQLRIAFPKVRRLAKFINFVLRRKAELKTFYLLLNEYERGKKEKQLTAEVVDFTVAKAIAQLMDHRNLLDVEFFRIELLDEAKVDTIGDIKPGIIDVS